MELILIMEEEMKIEIDVKLDGKSLNRFLIYHNYVRFSGVTGVVISLAAAVALFAEWNLWTQPQRVMLILLALLFTVMQPIMLISKGKRQLQMEEFQIPFHYVFDEEGIEISQNDQKQEFTWADVRKVVCRKTAVYVYMSSVSAFVIPEGQCEGRFAELTEMVRMNTGKTS